MSDGSSINIVGLVFTLAMGCLLIVLPRRYALAPVFILTCFMTMGQVVVVAGLHFQMLRVLIIFGWVRVICRREFVGLKFNAIDKAFIWWLMSSVITYTIMWGSVAALVYRLGISYDACGLYFLFRVLVKTRRDVLRAIQELAICIIPLSIAMVLEKVSGRNPFAMFGGVDAITRVRYGVLRCQGPFSHPILAGTFAAVTAPLFASLWFEGRTNKLLAVLGIVAAGIIPLTAGSAGPILAYAAGFCALMMWRIRRNIRMLRWSAIAALIVTQLLMNHPIWWAMEHIHVLSGNTGWYRALLIDQAWRHLGDWWLFGVRSTAYWGKLLTDVTNQYVRTGVDGGLITLFFFILVIKRCFGYIGLAIRRVDQSSRSDARLLWILGAALCVHLVAFIDVSYWDQTIVAWYALLGFISTLSGMLLTNRNPQQRHIATADAYAVYPGNAGFCPSAPASYATLLGRETSPPLRGASFTAP